MNTFLTTTDNIASKKLTFPPESPCIFLFHLFLNEYETIWKGLVIALLK
jgi:hypothetical protein